jgi:hypothetical protein
MDILIKKVKEKMTTSNRKQKIQLLTLVPMSWLYKDIEADFNVSNYMVRSSRKLLENKGILSCPERKKGKEISRDTVDKVIEFYCNDENSRQMPGKKDFVSISRRTHMQKRLILSNLKELYTKFKNNNPDIKIGFSTFCLHRPKWCVTVGASGTHTVCVSTIHQNARLLISAVKLSKDHRELTDMIVCNRSNRECMIHRCASCPDDSQLRIYLEIELYSQDDDDDPTIEYKQWKTADRADLLHMTETTTDFINILIEKLQKLTTHSYIAKCQAVYLKNVKNELTCNEVVVLGDFAENYQFVVQDEIQSFHWNKTQATLHPIVVYYKTNEELKHESICFMSDDLVHDLDMVYHSI